MLTILVFIGGFAAGVVLSAPVKSLVNRLYNAIRQMRKPTAKL